MITEPQPTPADISSFQRTAPLDAAGAAIKTFMGQSDPLSFTKGSSIPRNEAALKDERLPQTEMRASETESALQSALDALDSLPEKTWEQRLKDVECTKEKATQIIDAILTKGFYEETYKLTSKVSVTFKTRSFDHQEKVQQIIERDSPQFMGTVSLIMTKYNLAASLSNLGKTQFEVNEDGGYPKAFAFISKLPYMLYNVLIQKLSKFDRLVLSVMDEGALENF